MFYTGIITSLIPYILLLGLFGTLLLNHTAASFSKEKKKTTYAFYSQDAEENNSKDFYLSYRKIKNTRFCADYGASLNKHHIFSLQYPDLLKKFCHPAYIPLVVDLSINNTYSFRGPPGF
jgi:hypothetical protein